MEIVRPCPYCGEDNTILIDEYGGQRQQYVEDCQVCCQPWTVDVAFDSEGEVEVQLRASDE